MGKYSYDWAQEMINAAATPEMQKLAFSRDGIEFTEKDGGGVESEIERTAGKDCDCGADCGDSCDCDCHDKNADDGAVVAEASLEDTAELLLEISDELEQSGHERLAAASIALADVMIKEAKAKKKPKLGPGMKKQTGPHSSAESKKETAASPYSTSPGSRKKHDKKDTKGGKNGGKKLTLKERMAKMRAAQGKKK